MRGGGRTELWVIRFSRPRLKNWEGIQHGGPRQKRSTGRVTWGFLGEDVGSSGSKSAVGVFRDKKKQSGKSQQTEEEEGKGEGIEGDVT